MICPHCEHEKSSVVETRKTDEGVWRRRRCEGCEKSFISCESTSTSMRMPQAITDASLARLRVRPKKAAADITTTPYGISSGFAGWART